MPVNTSQYEIGGWYNGQQWNGQTLGAPGVINMPGVPGSGQPVSNEVIAQTNPNNVAYIQQQQQQMAGVQPGGAAQPGVAGAGAGMTLGNPQPTIDVQGVYNSAFNTPEITSAQAEIDVKQKAYDDAQAIINDNPFYSEATRVGKAQKLTQQFNAEMTRLQDKQARLKADAEIKVNLALKQYDINNQAYKDQLSLFNSMLSAGGLTNASGAELASYAVATGIPVSMLEGIIAKQKKEEISPQLITDDNGNVTIVDALTGNIINTVPGIGGKKTGTTTSDSKAIRQQFETASVSKNFDDLVNMFANTMTLEEIYTAYANTEKGRTYGPPNEKATEIQLLYKVARGEMTPEEARLQLFLGGS
jgi:hypothetical protein